MKPRRKVRIRWSPEFAYSLGLITTDGNLSPDGRHINLTSKDKQIVLNFKECLGLQNKIGKKARACSKEKKYLVVQFGDKIFYNFLLSIGLTPNKSKTIGTLKIRKKYFADFLRGCIDGDGNFDIHSHPESRFPQLKVRLCSASRVFLEWIKKEVTKSLKIKGGWFDNTKTVPSLCYGKTDSIRLLKFIYYNGVKYYLTRKYNKIVSFLGE